MPEFAKLEQPRVSVVVPNWNGMRHLPECLDALREQEYRDFEVVFVDNASTDESVSWIQENAPDARLRIRSVNGGFPASANTGIEAARGEFVVILANDTHPAPEWLGALVRAMDETGYDFGASRMVFYDTPDTINAAGDVYAVSWLFGAQRGRGEPVDRYRERVRVLGACAGAAIYRREFFRDVGTFDEQFFLVHEDTDLNLRALIAGKRCVYVPDAIVRHKDSATIRVLPELQSLIHRNQFRVLAKDLPARLFPYAVAVWLWRNGRRLFPVHPSAWHRLPRLWREFGQQVPLQLQGFRESWPKRRDVWSRRRIPVREIVRWLFDGVGPV